MATTFEIKVDNIDRVRTELAQQAVKALEECGLIAEGYAKGLCPVDTGNLRNSVTHKVDTEELICYIGSSVKYAPYVEFGTGVNYDQGGRKTPWVYQDAKGRWHRTSGQKAQPFIRPAVADHIPEYERIIKEGLEK